MEWVFVFFIVGSRVLAGDASGTFMSFRNNGNINKRTKSSAAVHAGRILREPSHENTDVRTTCSPHIICHNMPTGSELMTTHTDVKQTHNMMFHWPPHNTQHTSESLYVPETQLCQCKTQTRTHRNSTVTCLEILSYFGMNYANIEYVIIQNYSLLITIKGTNSPQAQTVL